MNFHLGQIHVRRDVQSLLPPAHGLGISVGDESLIDNFLDYAVRHEHLQMGLHGLVRVLRMVHPDTTRYPLDVRPLFLVADLVDGVEEPGLPRGSRGRGHGARRR